MTRINSYHTSLCVLCALLFLMAAPALAQQNNTNRASAPRSANLDPGAPMTTGGPMWGNVDGSTKTIRSQQSLHAGYMVPDGRGGFIWAGAYSEMKAPLPVHEAAQELKLKVRELADQLLSNTANGSIAGIIALPASFVSQDNFRQSSAFGRYIAEQMFYEFNQRGVPVREYRIGPELVSVPGQGDFMLTRQAGNIVMNSNRAAVIVGTYYSDDDNVFVNARLINGVNGMVLRTANVVFPQTEVTDSMLANSMVHLEPSYVGIKDFNTQTQMTDLSAIDLGEDIH